MKGVSAVTKRLGYPNRITLRKVFPEYHDSRYSHKQGNATRISCQNTCMFLIQEHTLLIFILPIQKNRGNHPFVAPRHDVLIGLSIGLTWIYSLILRLFQLIESPIKRSLRKLGNLQRFLEGDMT